MEVLKGQLGFSASQLKRVVMLYTIKPETVLIITQRVADLCC